MRHAAHVRSPSTRLLPVRLLIACCALVLAAACGGSPDERGAPAVTPTVVATQTAPTASATPSPSITETATATATATPTATATTTATAPPAEPTASTGALPLQALPRIEFVRADGTAVALPVEIPPRGEYPIGLSGRHELGERGMLFHWDDGSRARTFWMKNTHIDLDVAFLGPDFVVLEILGMEAESLEFHTSAEPCQYAVEAPAGWYAAHGVRPGATARFRFDLADYAAE